eukprot:482552-Pelagomonas_calceolata.AAC.6
MQGPAAELCPGEMLKESAGNKVAMSSEAPDLSVSVSFILLPVPDLILEHKLRSRPGPQSLPT